MKYDLLLNANASYAMREDLNAHFNVIDSKDIDNPADPQCANIVAMLTTQGADAALMDMLPHLKIIACIGVGYDAVDIHHAVTRRIVVTHTPNVLNQEVANTAIMMMLALSRRLMRNGAWIAQGKWPAGSPPLTESIEGQHIGIYGLGRIGRAIAKKLEAFNCRISYHSRRKVEGVDYHYISSLMTLAKEVDYLVVIVPATDATYHSVDKHVLGALGENGALINIARGNVVDEKALVAAITNGSLGSAALDVFEHEPHVPPALFNLENVLLLPHVGSATVTTRKLMADLAISNLIAFVTNGKAHTPVPECSKMLLAPT